MEALCKRSEPITTPFERALEHVHLSRVNKKILMERYNSLLLKMDNQALRLSISFHSSRCIITIGSLIVPALLSIQYTTGTGTNLGIYWTTWVVSLLVTICNGLSTLLKIDKQYFHLHTVREQLISDGWQYLELTGKYSGFHTPGHPPTHENQFIFFCHSVEKIRMKQIQEDYYKVNEAQQQGTVNQSQNALTSTRIVPTLLPPTPLQGDLALIPTEIKRAMEEISNTVVAVDDQASNT
jgi:hypothetical protein